MRLDVDIGNSRLKWRLGGRGPAVAVAPERWLESVGAAPVDSIHLCSVADPPAARAFVESCQKQWGLTPRVAEVSQGFCGVQLSYDNPLHFGVDRWLALLAARQQFPGRSVAVVSAGTALTVDLLDANDRHAGGYIVPGLGLAIDALLGRASRLKNQNIELQALPEAGRSTQACLSAGFSLMYLEFIRQALQTPLEGGPKVSLFTGGDAPRLFPLTGFLPERYLLPELVLDGLLQVFPD